MKMYRYTILTEDTNRGFILKAVGDNFDGFSLIHQTGFWQGNAERSLAITIIGDKREKHIVMRIADEIRSYNQQDEVWVTTERIAVDKVTR